jgi:preprotein translocase subunit SecF
MLELLPSGLHLDFIGKAKFYIAFARVVNASINQTLSRTILTSATVLMVVLALFFFGGEVIHAFAFVMLVGVIAGVYSTVFIASPILVAWHAYTQRHRTHRSPAGSVRQSP